MLTCCFQACCLLSVSPEAVTYILMGYDRTWVSDYCVAQGLCISVSWLLLHAGQAMQEAQEDDNNLVRDPIVPKVMVQIRDMAGDM